MEYRIHIEMSRGMLNLFASISKNKKKVFFIFAVFFKQNVISLRCIVDQCHKLTMGSQLDPQM